MPLLSCTARTCIYNKDEYCSKGDILVDGSEARVADETCCRSFEERGESASNKAAADSCGCRTIDVDCRMYLYFQQRREMPCGQDHDHRRKCLSL